jgi:hypothetical protein
MHLPFSFEVKHHVLRFDMSFHSLAVWFCARLFMSSIIIVVSLCALSFLPFVFYLFRPVVVRSVGTQTDHGTWSFPNISSPRLNGQSFSGVAREFYFLWRLSFSVRIDKTKNLSRLFIQSRSQLLIHVQDLYVLVVLRTRITRRNSLTSLSRVGANMSSRNPTTTIGSTRMRRIRLLSSRPRLCRTNDWIRKCSFESTFGYHCI